MRGLQEGKKWCRRAASGLCYLKEAKYAFRCYVMVKSFNHAAKLLKLRR
jgi:hypothetical protein